MSAVEVYVLKPFTYSTDGYTEKPADLYETIPDFPEKFFDGLNKAGYLRRAKIGDGKVSLKPSAEEIAKKVEPIVETAVKLQEALTTISETGNLPTKTTDEKVVDGSDVEIPDDWRSLKWFALRSLATKFGETPKNSEEAIAAIEAELARRG